MRHYIFYQNLAKFSMTLRSRIIQTLSDRGAQEINGFFFPFVGVVLRNQILNSKNEKSHEVQRIRWKEKLRWREGNPIRQ